ncbi:MAG: hypothetical protein U0K57_01190 [Lachnospiraceae bacterium]|nr:hypothetical protein [Lachnospiraceae bacterium]MEE1351812.1 hypothetical protein [Clostridia bacterium]
MGMIFMAAGRVLHFILKAVWKMICVAGVLLVCLAKIFIMMLLAMLQIVFGIVRLGETV